MKKYTIVLLFIIPFISSAQKPWDEYKIDSVTYTNVMGTVIQYQYQKRLKNESQNKRLCLWTGAKAMWLYEFAIYLGTIGYSVDFKPSEKNVLIKATHKVSITGNLPSVTLRANLNKNGQITSANINGPVDDLINIYVNYWELTPFSLNELKTKKQIIKNFISDKIIIKWTEGNLVISVIKNPDPGIDVFPL